MIDDISEELSDKCNNIQVDGISFIEKLSFNAFSEGTRLEHCIKMHKRLLAETELKDENIDYWLNNSNLTRLNYLEF